MFGTEEQKKKLLEALERRNESIQLLGQSFGKGMEKLGEQADDMLKTMGKLQKLVHELINLPGLLKQILENK